MLCYKFASNLVGLKIIIFIIFWPIKIEVSCAYWLAFSNYLSVINLVKKSILERKKTWKKRNKKSIKVT